MKKLILLLAIAFLTISMSSPRLENVCGDIRTDGYAVFYDNSTDSYYIQVVTSPAGGNVSYETLLMGTGESGYEIATQFCIGMQ